MVTIRRILSWPNGWLLAVCGSPIALIPLLQYLVFVPAGAELLFIIMSGVLLTSLPALAGLFVAPFLLFFRSLRSTALRVFIASVVLFYAVFAGARVGMRVRMSIFRGAAERNAPLVQAIRAYETRYRKPPPKLADLVPEFLPAVPGTGMAAYPQYKYYAGDNAARYDGNPWVLVVRVAYGLNFDQFLYFPLQNYPEGGYGGSLERIGDWAYVHE